MVGIKEAKGEYIGFVDSDDYCKQEMYETMLEVFKQNKEVELCYCDVFRDEEIVSQGVSGMLTKEEKIDLIYPFKSSLWNVLFKREKLKNMKFDEHIFYGEDLLFLIQYLLDMKGSIFHVNIPLYIHRNNSDSITNQKSLEKMNKNYSNFVLASQKAINELERHGIYDKKYYARYIDLVYHSYQKCKNFDGKDEIFSELGKYRDSFNAKQKIYYLLLKINKNSLYYARKILKR